MLYINFALGILIFLLIIFYLYIFLKNKEYLEGDKKIIIWDKLTPGEKVQYISNLYFPIISEQAKENINQISDENDFIASLPKDDTTCENGFSKCPDWAKNGECEINPEFMLYNCAKSCKACKYTDEDKNKLDKIYNSRKPSHCIYHGEEYPGEFSYLNKLYDYTTSIGL